MAEIEIRVATAQDVPVLTNLMAEWGHPTTEEEMQARFAAIEQDPSYHTLVATLQGRVVGMIGGQACLSFAKSGLNARMIALVVFASCRGKGIGKLLVRAFEDWAGARNAESLQVNSHTDRVEAHHFYRSLGYTSNGIRLVKKVARG